MGSFIKELSVAAEVFNFCISAVSPFDAYSSASSVQVALTSLPIEAAKASTQMASRL